MRKLFLPMAAVVAAIVVFLLASLPPQPETTSGAMEQTVRDRTVAGAFHVHSTRSDGAGERDAIAAAAARAGLQFVVLTDHGDGTRAPDPPAYLHGVLCIDGVEISTSQGHYIALDLAASPYPLGGTASVVVEDVRRLGGFGVVAHPHSAKGELSWTDWEDPVDGLEWLNADSEWRNEPRYRLTRAAFDYLLRPGPALASILDRPGPTLARWDALTESRPVVALAGHDAHGGVSERMEDQSRRSLLTLPSYEASFRTFAVRAILAEPPVGQPERDSRLLLDAIRAGRVFTAIDAVARPAWVDLRARVGDDELVMGQSRAYRDGTVLVVRSALPPGGRLVLLKNGASFEESTSGQMQATARGPGAYRLEVHAPASPGTPPVPWLLTNPIYLTDEQPTPVVEDPILGVALAIDQPGRVEKDPGSTATVTASGSRQTLEYRLRSGERVSQYAALVVPLQPPIPAFDRIVFAASAKRPMRLSVQLRFDRGGGERWGRSIYVSPDVGRHVVPLDTLQPLDRGSRPSSGQPDFATATSLLFVVDLTNAAPGAEGRFEISDLSLARRLPAR